MIAGALPTYLWQPMTAHAAPVFDNIAYSCLSEISRWHITIITLLNRRPPHIQVACVCQNLLSTSSAVFFFGMTASKLPAV